MLACGSIYWINMNADIEVTIKNYKLATSWFWTKQHKDKLMSMRYQRGCGNLSELISLKLIHYHITSLICRQYCGSIHRRAATPVNWNNLISIKTIHNSLQPTLPYRADLHSALINCRSVVNKTQEIQLELVNNSLDLCILTKTWIKECDTITPTRLCPNGYKSLSISRQDRVGGGIAIVYKSDLNISITSSQPFKTMELSCFSISTGNRLINLITIYRPPDSNVLEFCNELAKLLETNINLSGELILLGDFNIAVNKLLDAGPASFLDVLHSFNLINRVDKPTQRLCNTLRLNHSWGWLKYNPQNQSGQALLWP